MSRILVTGGAGFIGSHTIVELIAAGYDVVSVDNYYNSSPEVFSYIERITKRKVHHYELDVCDRNALSNIVEQYDFDGVIHFAGYKAVGESVKMPLTYYQNNIDSTLTLCDVCLQYKIHKIVFSSSATVYGEPDYLPFDESHPLRTTNPYGNSKLFIEHILRDLNKAYPELNVALLRYFNPVGAHPSGLIGETPKGTPNNLMPYICQVAAGIRKKLSVFGNDYDTVDGTGVRDFIHVLDLAKGHVAALAKLNDVSGCVTYNLGTGKGTSVLELLNCFTLINNVAVPYDFVPRRPGDIAAFWADPTKAEKELNWSTCLTLEDMVRDSWHYMKTGNVFPL